MIYATKDTDGTDIDQNATVKAYATVEEATKDLKEYYHDDNDPSSIFVGLEEGSFGDCWVKFYSDITPSSIEPFELDQLNISTAGSHPGGNCTWVTPRPPVYVAKFEYIEDEDE